jgi:exosortase
MTAPIIKYSETVAGAINRRRVAAFFLGAALLLALNGSVLLALCRYIVETDYQQHIALVPFISIFLGWRRLHENGSFPACCSSWRAGIVTALAGTIATFIGWKLRATGTISPDDALSFSALGLLAFLLSNALLTIGWNAIRPHLFAVCFLIFAIPLPDFIVHAINNFLQHSSADAAQLLLILGNTSVTRDGLLFHIHGLDFLVAEECSGIRATIVLLMVSLLAGHWVLRQKPHKILLVASVLPIAIFRNGFRIALLAWLTTHVDSRIIDSPLHHRGGPIFFLLGLVPFLGFLWWLVRRESKQTEAPIHTRRGPANSFLEP